MRPVRLSDRGAGRVSVCDFQGNAREGTISHFSPYSPNLIVETADGKKSLLQVEQLAYVIFAADPPPVEAEPPQLDRYKIHVFGANIHVVHVDPSTIDSPLGFYATPVNPTPACREYFFYAHGVNLRERDVQIGDLLVEANIVVPGQLQQGLAEQRVNRSIRVGEILVEQARVSPAVVDEAVQLQQRKRARLGEVLVEAGLVSKQDIDNALAEQKMRKGKRLGQILIELGVLTEQDLTATLAKKFRMNFVDLDQFNINPAAAASVPMDLVRKYNFIPLDSDDHCFTVAIGDPLATEIHDVLQFRLKKRVVEALATPTQLRKHVAQLLERGSTDDAMGLLLKQMAAGVEHEVEEQDDTSLGMESDSTTIKLANQIIVEAFRRGASDIHIEPNGRSDAVEIRFRIDGECVPYQEIPPAYRGPLVARIKIMSQLDISERRKPQDGKIRFRLADRQIELRVATLPTVNGNEDVVLRILAGSKPLPLENMGLSPRNLVALQDVIAKPYGLVLCVGPTGSGKTTTLHSALGSINTRDTKIWTAEDPVEITQKGLRQVQVNPKIGFTFAQAMRAFLRADPDVIMIGEMRDHETASTAVEASLTGHLVLSTLHTNSAPETVTRLLDMGLDPFSFADSLLGVLAQRLTKTLCPACKSSHPMDLADFEKLAKSYGRDAFLAKYGPWTPDVMTWKAQGCESCARSGYKGRIALHELLVVDDDVRAAIQRKAPIDDLRRLAAAGGMTTLLQDGIDKVMAGKTDMRQVLAVCSR